MYVCIPVVLAFNDIRACNCCTKGGYGAKELYCWFSHSFDCAGRPGVQSPCLEMTRTPSAACPLS